jgi:Mg/Co/Ni transporter MgtE
MSKFDDDFSKNDVDQQMQQLVIETLLRIYSLEKLLVNKGIVTEDEIIDEIEKSSSKYVENFMSLIKNNKLSN